VEGAEFFGIGDGFDGVAEAVGDGAEAEIEGGVVTEKGGELSFELPDSAVLGEDEGEDDWEGFGIAVAAQLCFPDALPLK
jgi:hypothetical protein